jgi:hypothetical protein
LNESYRLVTQRILDRVRGEPKGFFPQGPGGTGNASVKNCLFAKVRLEGVSYDGGGFAHSTNCTVEKFRSWEWTMQWTIIFGDDFVAE